MVSIIVAVLLIATVSLEQSVALQENGLNPKQFCGKFFDNFTATLNHDGFWKNENGVLIAVNKMVFETLNDEAILQLQNLTKFRDDYLKANSDNSPDNVEAKRIINRYAKASEKHAYKLANAQAHKLEQSYTNIIHDVLQTPHNTDMELQTLMNSKMQAVHTNFMDLCTLAVDDIRTDIKESEDNIQRTSDIIKSSGIKSENLPRAFVPVEFSSVLVSFHDAFDGLQTTHQDTGYATYVKEYTHQVSEKLFKRVHQQVRDAIKTLKTNIKSMKTTRGAKSKLIDQVKLLTKDFRIKFKDIRISIQDKFYNALSNLAESKNPESPEHIADFCQREYSNYSQELNSIGESTVKSVLEIQKTLADSVYNESVPPSEIPNSPTISVAPVVQTLVPASSVVPIQQAAPSLVSIQPATPSLVPVAPAVLAESVISPAGLTSPSVLPQSVVPVAPVPSILSSPVASIIGTSSLVAPAPVPTSQVPSSPVQSQAVITPGLPFPAVSSPPAPSPTVTPVPVSSALAASVSLPTVAPAPVSTQPIIPATLPFPSVANPSEPVTTMLH